MQIQKLIFIMLLMLVINAQAEQAIQFVVLPAHVAKGISRQGTWKPTKADIEGVEANISQVSNLKAEGWSPAIHIDHPERYFRQYVPILRDKQKMVYVNAFCDAPAYWRTQLVVVADGATCYWQALYNPATKKYSHLMINARA